MVLYMYKIKGYPIFKFDKEDVEICFFINQITY